jgi:Domain of unknown function (DUF3331)
MPKAAWSHTVDLLTAGLQPVPKPEAAVACRARSVGRVARAGQPCIEETLDNSRSTTRFEILEWTPGNSLVVCWCDPTAGRYGEQSWKLSVARGVSICAFSGKRIKRGDKIFRPYWRGAKPANAEQSILASALEQDALEKLSGDQLRQGVTLQKYGLEHRYAPSGIET